MNASVTQFARKVDWSASDRSMRGAIVRFVHGLHDRRQNCVNLKQIQKWFSGTPAEFVAQQVDQLVSSHYLVMLRTSLNRKRCTYTYDVTNMGIALMLNWSTWDTPKGREQASREREKGAK